jgi:hypothetical protein
MKDAEEIKILQIFIACSYALFAGCGLFFIIWPPKKINSLFGYHSENAGRNQATWDFANKLAFRLMFFIAQVSLVLALGSVYFLAGKIPVDGLWVICVFWLYFLYVIILPVVEIKLSRFEEKQKSNPA